MGTGFGSRCAALLLRELELARNALELLPRGQELGLELELRSLQLLLHRVLALARLPRRGLRLLRDLERVPDLGQLVRLAASGLEQRVRVRQLGLHALQLPGLVAVGVAEVEAEAEDKLGLG